MSFLCYNRLGDNMKSLMSLNVEKFKQVQSLNFYNMIKGKIDGCEIFFNINKYYQNLQNTDRLFSIFKYF